MGLVSKDHVWVMPVLTDGWWENEVDGCTTQQIRDGLLTNVLFVDPYPWDPDNNTAESGRVCVVCTHIMCVIFDLPCL